MMVWRTWALSIALIARVLAVGQDAGPERLIYPEKLHEDLEVLRSFIHEVHPAPYRFRSSEALDAVFDSVRRAVKVPLSPAAFLDSVMPVFHAVGDPRLRPSLGGGVNGGEVMPLIPIRVKILEGNIYVEEELKGFRSLPIGSRITAINGIGADAILDRLGRVIVSEVAGMTFRHRRIEHEFATLYARHIDGSGDYLVRYVAMDGTVGEQRIKGMTSGEIALSRKPAGKAVAPWSGVPDPEAGAFWLTIQTFERDSLQRAKQKPESYLARLLKELRRSKTRTLVIDVRGAGGRELGMAELVFGVIAREPFRIIQDMSVRSTVPPARYDLARPQPEFYAMVREQFVEDPGHGAHLRPDDVRLRPVPPANKAFDGAVYVVCDGLTLDAGAAFVMLVKRERRGRIIGEELGTNAHSFTGGREMVVTMPNAGLRVHVPLLRYVPDGSPTVPADSGELPHHVVHQQASGIARGRDTVREGVMQLLLELR